MPFSQKRPSEEVRRKQQMSQASSSKDVPTRHSYTNAGWQREFIEGQEMKAFNTFNQTHIGGLRADWGLDADGNFIEDSDEANDNDDVDDNEDIDGEVEQHDDATGEQSMPETSVAKVFMRKNVFVVQFETTEPWPNGTELIESKYASITFDDLQNLDPNAEPVALIQQHSRGGVPFKNMGLLNPSQLRTVLRQLRYEKSPGDTSWRRPDVDQRRLCIEDSTPEAIAVLMETASSIDAPAIHELLYRHLTRSASVGVSISSRNFLSFMFRLSLPYYTLVSKTQRKVSPSQHEVVSIPSFGNFVVGQTTIVLVGLDDQRWTAIAIVDGNIRKIANDNPDNVQKDPITGTITSIPKTSQNARLYFLWLWKEWIDRVRDNWAAVVDAIESRIQQKVERDMHLMAIDDLDVTGQLMASITTGAQLYLRLSHIHTKLSGTIETWDDFEKCGAKYFQNDSMPSDDIYATRDSVQGIETTYVELGAISRRLERSMANLNGHQLSNVLGARMGMQSLHESRAAAETHERIVLSTAHTQRDITMKVAESQEDVAKTAWKATLTTMALLPFMLVFTLFSMEKSMIPLPTSFRMLAYSLLGFTLVMIVFFTVLDTLLRKLSNLFHALFDLLLRMLNSVARPPRKELGSMDEPDWS